jgi:hypothetical protein
VVASGPQKEETLSCERIDLGPCCACGATGPSVRNIIMLDCKAPIAGTGWGCFQCGLASDGAVAVLCDRCLEEHREPVRAVAGYPKSGGRVPVASLTGRHEHRLHLHNEAIGHG